jgi:AmmeMemoRadiSam system protein A
MKHRLVTLAREAIKRHLAGETGAQTIAEGSGPLPWGVFVSLHEPAPPGAEGPLRGCIGSLDLDATSLEREVERVAVSSATADPRFRPLRPDEVYALEVTVYLLNPPEVVDGPDDLDPQEFGVIVTGGRGRRGLLLPAIAGIDTPERQVEVAMRKAGLEQRDDVRIERFTADILH